MLNYSHDNNSKQTFSWTLTYDTTLNTFYSVSPLKSYSGIHLLTSWYGLCTRSVEAKATNADN